MDGKTHRRIGKAAGTIGAVVRSRPNEELWKVGAEALGGYLGGTLGCGLPDILEPALHSYHRDIGHSVMTAAGIIYASVEMLGSWESYCRDKADAVGQLRGERPNDLDLATKQFLWHVAAGFAAGLAVGYVSHLALDAMTPRGIPLVMRGF